MEEIYIGKIPGYNSNINPGTPDYEKNLLKGITTVSMKPTAYVVNLNPFDQTKDGGANAFTQGSPLFQIGSSVNSAGGATADALEHWKNITKANNGLLGGTDADFLRILATADSTISESIENRFEENFYAKLLNGSTSNKTIDSIRSGINAFKKGVTGLNSMAGAKILETINTGSSVADLLAASISGIKVELPKTWEDTAYSSSMSLMVKLISPSGHPEDIKNFVEIPLHYLLLASAPVTYNGLTYGFPPLWEIHATGLMYLKLGVISNIVITRGGNDTSFNKHNQPLSIDVRLTLTPLNNSFATPMYPHLQDRYGTLMTTEWDVKRSLDVSDPVFREFTDVNHLDGKYVQL